MEKLFPTPMIQMFSHSILYVKSQLYMLSSCNGSSGQVYGMTMIGTTFTAIFERHVMHSQSCNLAYLMCISHKSFTARSDVFGSSSYQQSAVGIAYHMTLLMLPLYQFLRMDLMNFGRTCHSYTYTQYLMIIVIHSQLISSHFIAVCILDIPANCCLSKFNNNN